MLELGIDDIPPLPDRTGHAGLTLLHVGRGVRTKGLRDVVRAMGQLRDIPGLRLISAGAGEEIALCRAEAAALGIAEQVKFLGLIPRDQVEGLYREADIFAFPSFREPAGNVLYEAMRWGLPVIAADRGGPGHIVTDQTGIRVGVTTPDAMARDVAAAIRRLAEDPDLRQRMGAAGRDKVAAEGLWSDKAARLVRLYESVIGQTA